jgi:hypothetical protein
MTDDKEKILVAVEGQLDQHFAELRQIFAEGFDRVNNPALKGQA